MQAEVVAAAASSGAARRVVIWGVPAVVVLVFIGAVALAPAVAPADIVFGAVMGTVVTILALVGAILADRAPANRIGAWLLIASSLVTAGLALGSYATAGHAATQNQWPGAGVAAAVGNFPFVIAVGILLIGIPAIFPTGALLSRRWRSLIGLSVAALLATCLSMLIQGGTVTAPGTMTVADALAGLSSLSLGVCFIGALSAVAIRFRRGSPIERQQTKWFFAAAAFAVTALLAAFWVPEATLAGIVLFGLALVAQPVAIGVAVLRYRLYAIDRIVSRTIAYSVLTGVLVAVYSIVVILVRAVLGDVATGGSAGVALSTLVVASLFHPIRRRVQSIVDRRFNRESYDAERTVAGFSQRLRDEVHLDAVIVGLDITVRLAVAPTAAGIWLRKARPRSL